MNIVSVDSIENNFDSGQIPPISNEITKRIVDSSYVINMDSDTDRLNEFNLLMKDWKCIRHSGINGKLLMSIINSPICLPDAHKDISLKEKYINNATWLSPGEIGCLLSHVTLWELFVNDPDKNRIAIFEDDARSHVDTTTVFRHLSEFYNHLQDKNIPEPDILYLGKSLDDCISYERVWNNVYKSRHSLCLHAYIITKSGARKLLSMAPYSLAIDMIPIKAVERNIITTMAFHPSIYFQDVFNISSNFNKIKSVINNTTECIVSQQHVTSDNWNYITIILIGIIAALILFILFF